MAATPLDDLDAHVRRTDPDRWLAARFVGDPAARRELLALYALTDEWARIGDTVTQPLIGEMRLAWWRETLCEAVEGRPRKGHPLLEALGPALKDKRLPLELLEPMLDARAADFETTPFADEAAVERYLDGTAGALMKAAAVLLDLAAEPVETQGAGRTWGWAGLSRAESAWRERGRRWAPAQWGDASPQALAARVRQKVDEALRAAGSQLGSLPVASFPAVAYATLARDYARGRTPGDLRKRTRLLLATTLGRI